MGLFSTERSQTPQAFPKLTEREREILVMIAQGRNNAEISAEPFLSLKTAQNRVSNIFRKLQVAPDVGRNPRERPASAGKSLSRSEGRRTITQNPANMVRVLFVCMGNIWSLIQKHTATKLRFRSLLTGGVQEVRLERLVPG